MADSLPTGAKCIKCHVTSPQYIDLKCKHKLCKNCTKKLKFDDKIFCPSKSCWVVTNPVPKLKRQLSTPSIQRRESTASIQSISSAVQVVVSQYKEQMVKKEKRCFDQIEKLEKSVKNLQQKEKKQMKDITKMFNRRMRQLEDHYGGLRRKASDSFRERESQLETILLDVKDILCQIRDEIGQLQESLNSRQATESEMEQIEELRRRTSECQRQTIQVEIPEMEVQVKESEEFDLSDSIDITAPTPTMRTNIPKPVRIKALDMLSEHHWIRQERSLDLPASPICLRLLSDQLWQCHGDGVTVMSPELEVSTADHGDSDATYDMAALDNGDLLVASRSGLYQTNHEGGARKQLAEGWFTSVAQHAGRLYAAEYATGHIRVYQQDKDHWIQCDVVHLEREEQEVTLSISDGILYAGLSDENKLVAYNLSGELQGSWGKRGSGRKGHLNCPFLCMTGAGGAALIADEHNDRLQVLSTDRKWSVVKLQPPVRRPVSALLLRDRLYVSSWKDRKLYMYDLA